MTATPINMDRLIEAHQAVKMARAARKQLFDEEDAKLEADQNMIRAVILDHLNKTGAQSIATEHGTAYRREVLKPSAADWSAIWEWMKAHDGFDIMERRLKAGFVKEYIENHNGQLPPGVNAHYEYEVSVRRPTKSSKPEEKND